MGGYVKKKKDMVFQSVDSLQQIVNVVNEAAAAVNDSKRTIKESAIPEVLAGALGAGIGGVGSFAALYGLGVVGLSAAGITSGLAAAGAVVGGGMVAGIFVYIKDIAEYLQKSFNGQSDVPMSDVWALLDNHPIFPSDGFRSQIKNELKQNHGASVSRSTISFVDRS